MNINIDISVLPAQAEFLNFNIPNLAFIGGYGSGKTEALIYNIMIRKLMVLKMGVKNHKAALYTTDHKQMMTVLVARITYMLEKNNIPYIHDKQGKNSIILGWDLGEILLRTYTHPHRIVGYAVNDSYLDELDTLPYDKAADIWEKTKARNRLRYDVDLINTMRVATTPEGLKFVYSLFDGGNRRQKEKNGYYYIQAKTKENPYLPKSYVDELMLTYDNKRVKAYLEGEFVNLNSGLVYYNYNDGCLKKINNVASHAFFHVGQDFNVGGCVSIVLVENDETIYVVDEIVSYDTQSIAINLDNKYGIAKILLYPDASGSNRSSNAASTDIAILQNYGYTVYFSNRNPYVRDRVNIINFLLGKGLLKIDKTKCPRLHEALSNQGYDAKGEPEKFSGSATIDDFVDALGYCIYYRYGYKINERIKK